jgi:hypothetical protein
MSLLQLQSIVRREKLLDSNFHARHAAARESADFAGLEGDDAVFGGVDGEVTAHFGAGTGTLGHADLADDDLAGLNFLAAKKLNAKALAGAVVDIFGGTASFDV